MYFATETTREQCQKTIREKVQEVIRWINKQNLHDTELYAVLPSPDGLGVRVGFNSIQAVPLLKRLHEEVFSTVFEAPMLRLDDKVWSAWFGYSEPFSAPTCYFPQ